MSFLSQFTLSEPLMRWREPNAYSRRDLSRLRAWIGFALIFMAPILLLFIAPYTDMDSSPGRNIFVASFLWVVGTLAFLRIWFGPGNVVCLQRDHVSKASSRPTLRTRYKDIVSCSVSHDSYHDAKFAIVAFALKKGLPAGQVRQIALPDDSSLERALHILQDKGIKIEGHDMPPNQSPEPTRLVTTDSHLSLQVHHVTIFAWLSFGR